VTINFYTSRLSNGSLCVVFVLLVLLSNVLVTTVINEVALPPAGSFSTCMGRVRVRHLVQIQPPTFTQPSHPFVGRRSEYQRKLGVNTEQANHAMRPYIRGVSWCLTED